MLRGDQAIALESLALRQQLAVFKRTMKHPPLRPRDRLFWMLTGQRLAAGCPSPNVLTKVYGHFPEPEPWESCPWLSEQ